MMTTDAIVQATWSNDCVFRFLYRGHFDCLEKLEAIVFGQSFKLIPYYAWTIEINYATRYSWIWYQNMCINDGLIQGTF